MINKVKILQKDIKCNKKIKNIIYNKTYIDNIKFINYNKTRTIEQLI